MQQLIPFQFDAHNVRVHLDEFGAPWWVLADVCSVLGIHNPSDTAHRLDPSNLYTLGLTEGTYLNIINEAGLYEVIFRSRKPEARRFRQWVFAEVLPQIRQTGRYEPQPTPASLALPEPLTLALVQMTQGITALAAQTTHLGAQLTALDTRLQAVETQATARSGYYTLMAYARLHKIALPLSEARQHGMALKKKARQAGINLGECPDERYGKVNTYPEELLQEYFQALLAAESLVHDIQQRHDAKDTRLL